MKYFLTVFTVFGLFLAGFAHANPVSIAVVDVQQLLTKSEAAKSVQKQTQDLRDKFLKGLSEKEKTLREEEKKLIEQSKELSQEDFLEKKKAFEQKFIDTQTDAKKRKGAIDKAYGKAMKELMDNIYQVVQSVADDNKYGLVISKQSVVIGAQSLDITDESLKRLNDKVSKIKLDVK